MSVETSRIEVVMPAMGDSVAEGTVLEWHKQEGDSIAVDETLVEISTDKVDAEVPSPVAGTVVKIHAAEGDTVTVGSVLAEISTNGDMPAASTSNGGNGAAAGNGSSAPPAAAGPVSGESPPATKAEEVAGAAQEAEGLAEAEAGSGETVEIVTPTGGESVTEGTILEWSVKVGDTVTDGDTVVEISTDKVDMELPAPAAGTITEILAEEGETVTVGQVIARMSASGSAAPARLRGRASPWPRPSTPPPTERRRSTAPPPTPRRSPGAWPPPRASISAACGAAPAGRITKADVLAAQQNGTPPTTPAARQPPRTAPAPAEAGAQLIKGGGAVLARYMDQSRSIPTATSFRTLTVTTLEARRKELKAAERKVSFTHLIAYAIARAADDMPVMANHFAEIDGKSPTASTTATSTSGWRSTWRRRTARAR